jgi:hypothetical protein
MACEGAAGDSVPTATAVGCVAWDGVRGRSPCWPVHALDALPVMARGCPIRARWRSGRSNHGVESCADRSSHGLLVPAQRLAHQPRRTYRSGTPSSHDSTENRHDLGPRAASGCMRWLGGTTPEGRADLPAMLAFAGVPCDGVRGRSSCALLGAMAVGCVLGDGARGRCPRWRSHHDSGRMRCLG